MNDGEERMDQADGLSDNVVLLPRVERKDEIVGVVEEGRLLASGLTLWVQNTAARDHC